MQHHTEYFLLSSTHWNLVYNEIQKVLMQPYPEKGSFLAESDQLAAINQEILETNKSLDNPDAMLSLKDATVKRALLNLQGGLLKHGISIECLDRFLSIIQYLTDGQGASPIEWQTFIGTREATEIAVAASFSGYLELVKYVTKHLQVSRACVNRMLMKATFLHHHDIVQYLVDSCNADLSQFNWQPIRYLAMGNNLPIIQRMINDWDADLFDIIPSVADKGHLDIVKYLIEEKSVDPAEFLPAAANKGHLNIVKYLIEEKAVDPAQFLLAAIDKAYLPVLHYLVNETRVRLPDNDTSLLRAAEKGHFEIVKFLLDSGAANPNVHAGKVILSAFKQNKLELVKTFFQYDILKDLNSNNQLLDLYKKFKYDNDAHINTDTSDLSKLTEDLQLHIAGHYLDYHAIKNLRHTCRTFFKKYPLEAIQKHKSRTLVATSMYSTFVSHNNALFSVEERHSCTVSSLTGKLQNLEKAGNIRGLEAGLQHLIVHCEHGFYLYQSTKLAEFDFANSEGINPFVFYSEEELQYGKIIAVIAGEKHTIVHCEKGLLVSGDNANGQLGFGDTINRPDFTPLSDATRGLIEASGGIVSVHSGYYSNILVCRNAILVSGSNHCGELGLGHNQLQSTWIALPEEICQPIQAAGKILSVAISLHTVIVCENGIFVSGCNDAGQLGFDDNSNRNTFTPLPDATIELIKQAGGFKRLLVGKYHTMIICTNGILVCGRNEYGQLGLGSQLEMPPHQYTLCPIPDELLENMRNLAEIADVALGRSHSVIAYNNGMLFSSGRLSGVADYNKDTQMLNRFTCTFDAAAGLANTTSKPFSF